MSQFRLASLVFRELRAAGHRVQRQRNITVHSVGRLQSPIIEDSVLWFVTLLWRNDINQDGEHWPHGHRQTKRYWERNLGEQNNWQRMGFRCNWSIQIHLVTWLNQQITWGHSIYLTYKTAYYLAWTTAIHVFSAVPREGCGVNDDDGNVNVRHLQTRGGHSVHHDDGCCCYYHLTCNFSWDLTYIFCPLWLHVGHWTGTCGWKAYILEHLTWRRDCYSLEHHITCRDWIHASFQTAVNNPCS